MNVYEYCKIPYICIQKTGELLSTRGKYFVLYYSAIALWKIFLPFLITTGSERSTRPLGSVNFSPFTAMPFWGRFFVFVGAIMALFKMIWRKNMFRRFRYLFQFIKSDKKTRNKNPYYDMRRDGEDGVIPFCIAISIAALWEIF